ncbi:MAG: class I SAM-dependent methyltransferase [Thiohalocapsa sp.]
MAEEAAPSPYAGDREFWNSAGARAWTDHHERQDRALAGLAEAALAAAAPQPGESALDIGCGSGTTVLELAARVGSHGTVLGVDIAEASVARGRERIAAAGLRQAEIIAADAATHAFPPQRFDLLFSRLGVMFFADPAAAFANLHGALKPDGRLALAVFRPAAENPWPSAPHDAVRHLLPPTPPPRPGDPGMFSWSDPAQVRAILESAGFRDISFTAVDLDYRIAGSGGAAEAADFAMLFGPLTRLLPLLSAERCQEVRATLEKFFRGHETPDGVALPAAFWLVQARA